MKIILITQNEPFFLAKNIHYLCKILPKEVTIEGVILYEPSPFGKKQSLLHKAIKTISIFGVNFFMYYSIKFLLSKFNDNLNVKKTIQKLGLKIIKLNKPINHKDSLRLIKSYRPSLLVSILGTEIFREPLIKLAPYGCINLHSSLLPKYRGLMPTFWILKNKEKKSGVSVFFMDEGIDSGPIIVQKKFHIDKISHKNLIKKTKRLGMEAIAEAIKKIKNNEVVLIPNDNNEKSYYSFPKRSNVKEFIKGGNTFF